MIFSIDPVLITFEDLLKFDKNDVLVLFLEGTKSNGRGLLISQIEEDKLNSLKLDFVLYGIKYDGDFCVSIAFGSEWLHFMKLLVANVGMKVYNTGCVRNDVLGDSKREMEAFRKDAMNVKKGDTSMAMRKKMEVKVVPSVMEQLGALLRLKLVGLGLEDKKLFLEFYKAKNTKK
jgi:hypothetical protein